MKARNTPQPQAQEDQRNAEDHAEFEAWLDSTEGKRWLEHEDHPAISFWNHDGFNPEVCGHA